MPKRSNTEDWIEAIRVFIRDTLGNKNWQIVKDKEKTMLGISFEDGIRSIKYIPCKWQRSSANEIKHFMEAVHYLYIKKKVPIDEAFERVKIKALKDEVNTATKTDSKDILNAWEKYRIYLTTNTTTNKVSESTYKKFYGQTQRALVNSSKSE